MTHFVKETRVKIDGRKARGAATRALILASTRELLPDLGPELTLDTLADQVGLTKQAILHHFPSKERIFVELALEVVQAESDVALAAVEGVTGVDALEAFVRGVIAFYFGDVDGFRLVYLRGQLLPGSLRWFPLEERRERLYPVTARMYDAVEAAVRAGPNVRSGIDPRALVLAAHFAAVGFATMYGATVATGDPMKRGFDDYLDVFLATWRSGLAR